MKAELNRIVLRKMIRLLGPRITETSVWIDGEYGPSMQSRIENAQARLDRIRQWAKEQSDKAVRAAYLEWIEFYEQGLREARREMKTQERRAQHERVKERMEQDMANIRQYERTHYVPEPTL